MGSLDLKVSHRVVDYIVVTRFPRGTFYASAAMAFLVVVAGGVFTMHTQDSAARKLRHDFAGRAALAAQLTEGVLFGQSDQTVAYSKATYSGPEDTVQAAVDADQAADPSEVRSIVMRADGRLLGVYPHSLAGQARALANRPEMVKARNGHYTYSNVLSTSSGNVIMVAVPFIAPGGRRVWAGSITVGQISALAKGYLTSALGLSEGSAFLIDSSRVAIASTGGVAPGTVLNDSAFAALKGNTGTLNGYDYATYPVPNTTWRVAFQAPTAVLLAPLTSTRHAAWQLFSAFALAMLCVVGLAALALRSSRRLAHERLHDGLTGLPNRALFINHTERALAAVRTRGGELAALFIDLDRFKEVNDTHGHAVGDTVLTLVAKRLIEAVRSCDVVGRLGGDEFLILCLDLVDHEQGIEIAQRVQQVLAAPYEVGRFTLTVDCSIGIAFYAGEGRLDAGNLIHYADVAMYQAKQHGRARIESVEALAVPLPDDEPGTTEPGSQRRVLAGAISHDAGPPS